MDHPTLSLSSNATSPMLRPLSPSPSLSPSFASGTHLSLDRSDSMQSTGSSVSSRSVSSSSQPSDASSNARRRNGFMRPQGTEFSESARARDSVMCLGSIAALQYYFARTGLLEGKGAQMAKQKPPADATAGAEGEEATPAPEQEPDNTWEHMEPPAVSTYRYKEPTTEPLPETPVLRHQLRIALDDARKVLERSAKEKAGPPREETVRVIVEQDASEPNSSRENTGGSGPQRWEEVQGLDILDVVTLSIRQARVYYITHAYPQALYALRSERQIRSDLYNVLDILKRMASRDFHGGIRPDERSGILSWIQGIHDLLSEEVKQEAIELTRRHQSRWRSGDWQGRELEREWHFLTSFDLDPTPLPKWEPNSPMPSDFLLALSKGLRLVSLHNEMVRRSKRPFGRITTFYTDLEKPYRCADNLRYWAKAAELRWEIKLNFDALDVVHGESEQAWLKFEQAVRAWCKGVREELTNEWADTETILSNAKAGVAF